MIQTTADVGTQWIRDLCNEIVKEGCLVFIAAFSLVYSSDECTAHWISCC